MQNWTDYVALFANIIAFIANALAAIASGIAIYLFAYKGKYLKSVFNALVTYSSQLTLSELQTKLDLLNDLHAISDEQCDEIVNVLNDIAGQLRGNPSLTHHFSDLLERITKATANKNKIKEPDKRAIVSEIREKIRHVGVLNMDAMSGENK